MAGDVLTRGQRAALDEFVETILTTGLSPRNDVFGALLGPIACLLDGDVVAWHELSFVATSAQTFMWPDPSLRAQAEEQMVEGRDTHPLITHYARTRSMDVCDVRDVCTRTTWRQSPAYRVIRSHYGVTEQLAIPVSYVGDTYVSYAVGRESGVFGDRERIAAAWIQRVLVGAMRTGPSTAGSRNAVLRGSPAPVLTPRESSVLDLLATGRPRIAAAHALNMAPRTLDKHVEHIYTKLGVNCLLSALKARAELS